jgi:hypothetical protein
MIPMSSERVTFDTQDITTSERIAVLETKLESLQETIDGMRDEQKAQHESLCKKFEQVSERISVLERWRFMIFGGALVVGYMLAHIKVEKLF